LPALVSPVSENGELREEVAERLIPHLYRTGINGLYVCGQTGEGWQLSIAARKRLLEIAVRLAPAGAITMAHVGTTCLADAIDLARHAGACGAQAVSSLPPPGAASLGELVEWYRRLAAASPLPLYVYYFPGLSAGIHSANDLRAICNLDNVAGLKFTDANLDWLIEILNDGNNVLFGRDEMLAAGFLYKADGAIGTFYNAVPQWAINVYQAARAGRWDDALEWSERIRALIDVLRAYPILSAFKLMMKWQGFDCGPALPPRRNLTPEQEANFRRDLDKAGFGDLVKPVV
jgi:N-acetylneuraminate lyase